MSYRHQQSITNYFPAKTPLGHMSMLGSKVPMQRRKGLLGNAIDVVSATTPYAMAKKVRAANGLGQFDSGSGFTAISTGALVAILCVFGALSYETGKAMAPNNSKAKKWGWIGVPVGMITGPVGLGIMGIISNAEQKR